MGELFFSTSLRCGIEIFPKHSPDNRASRPHYISGSRMVFHTHFKELPNLSVSVSSVSLRFLLNNSIPAGKQEIRLADTALDITIQEAHLQRAASSPKAKEADRVLHN
jgi:hypothetical protein